MFVDPEDQYLKDVSAVMAAALAEAFGPLLGSRPLLTVPQAASKLGVKRRTMEEMIRQGEIGSLLVRGARRVEQEEIERYVAARREAQDG